MHKTSKYVEIDTRISHAENEEKGNFPLCQNQSNILQANMCIYHTAYPLRCTCSSNAIKIFEYIFSMGHALPLVFWSPAYFRQLMHFHIKNYITFTPPATYYMHIFHPRTENECMIC